MALRDDSADVERLFTALVEVMWARDGAPRLRRPLQVSEIYQHIVPYRVYRDRLGIDQNQDYEMAVLRLLAGEGGYARVEPEEARVLLAEEAESPNPDPTLVREYAAAQVVLDAVAVKRVLERERDYGPGDAVDVAETAHGEEAADALPEPAPLRPSAPAFALEPDDAAPPAAEPEPSPRPSAPAAHGGSCKSCGRTLPLHRTVVYCPFCGQTAAGRVCPECGDDLEPGWRFCVTCGAPPAR